MLLVGNVPKIAFKVSKRKIGHLLVIVESYDIQVPSHISSKEHLSVTFGQRSVWFVKIVPVLER